MNTVNIPLNLIATIMGSHYQAKYPDIDLALVYDLGWKTVTPVILEITRP